MDLGAGFKPAMQALPLSIPFQPAKRAGKTGPSCPDLPAIFLLP
jgi:hypothetical protein